LSFELKTALALLAVTVVVLLPGCGAMRPLDTEQAARLPLYEERAARLEMLDSWGLEGR
jgi:outer membrane biogenesis lipoprotein LolB